MPVGGDPGADHEPIASSCIFPTDNISCAYFLLVALFVLVVLFLLVVLISASVVLVSA